MNLQIKRVHSSDDMSILGQIFFNSGKADIYLKKTDEFVYAKVEKGTIFIDPCVLEIRNIGSERNTIAHECVHWYMHRQYHVIQIMAGSENAVARRCPIEPPSEQLQSVWTCEDWMEWKANGIAPKILMPKIPFIQYVNENPLYMKNIKGINTNPINTDSFINSLAMFFNVSK